MNDGGRAFPENQGSDVCPSCDLFIGRSRGMSLRDAFAITAPFGVGDVTNILVAGKSGAEKMSVQELCEEIAAIRWIYADAMLAERLKAREEK